MKPIKYCNKHRGSFFPSLESNGCKECEKLYKEWQKQAINLESKK